ncbi:MAG: hypothetical protein IT175_09860 [Acidobacteria bacterium]|nr:hypothetical protein [Acidobacteriota bacterium]
MSTNVVSFPTPTVREPRPSPAWSLSTALRRLGLVRIAPTAWPDGAEAFGHGRFVAVRPECPSPTRAILVEVARLCAGPRATTPFSGESETGLPATRRAEIVADCVRSLAECPSPPEHVSVRLHELSPLERERVARLARRIYEAGLEPHRGNARGERGARPTAPRGKPGRRRLRPEG